MILICLKVNNLYSRKIDIILMLSVLKPKKENISLIFCIIYNIFFFRWFAFMGDAASSYVPFQINYFPSNDLSDPNILNATAIPCSESYDVSSTSKYRV